MIHKNTLAVAVMESTLLNNSCTIKGISFFEELFILKSTREYRRDKKNAKTFIFKKISKGMSCMNWKKMFFIKGDSITVAASATLHITMTS